MSPAEFFAKMISPTLIYVWSLVFILLAIQIIFALLKLSRLGSARIRDVDDMDGRDFELYLTDLFRALGYRVRCTRYRGDYGADLVGEKDGISYAIQAKRHSKPVGIAAVQQAVASKGYYQCEKAMVVTNSTFTHSAIELAKANDVELWDRDRLVSAILQRQRQGKQVPPVATLPDNTREMPLEITLHTSAAEMPISCANTANCAVCGKEVTPKVRQYCLDHPERFQGRVYCYPHQQQIRKPQMH